MYGKIPRFVFLARVIARSRRIRVKDNYYTNGQNYDYYSENNYYRNIVWYLIV